MSASLQNDIADKLETIIAAIDDPDNAGQKLLKETTSEETKDISAYPAVKIVSGGYNETYQNLRDTRREYSFIIRIYGQVKDNTDFADVQRKVRLIADVIRDTLGLQTNITLNGLIDFSNLSEGAPTSATRFGEFYVFPITYKAVKLFNRYT